MSSDTIADTTPDTPAREGSGREWLLLLFGLGGVAVAGAAYNMANGGDLVGCTPETAENCASVLLPVLSEHLGFSTPLLGLIGYGLIALVTLGILALKPGPSVALRDRLVLGRRVLLLGALGFSVYFMMFQALWVGVYCPICVSSAGASLSLFLIDATRPRPKTEEGGRLPSWLSKTMAAGITVALIAGIGTYTLWATKAWHPLEGPIMAKKALFELGEEARTPLADPDPRPQLVMASKAGCLVCIQFYGETMDDPRVHQLVQRFRLQHAEYPNDNGILNLLPSGITPTLHIVAPNGQPIARLDRTLNTEAVVDFLERFAPPAADDAPDTAPE